MIVLTAAATINVLNKMETKKSINKWVWIAIIAVIIIGGIFYWINKVPVPPVLP